MPQLLYAPAGRMSGRPIGTAARAVRGFLGVLVLGLLLSLGLPGNGSAQQAPTGAIIMPLNGSSTHEHPSKKKIKKIDVDPANIIRVRLLQPNFNSVVIVAEGVGRATVRLTDEDDKVDEFDVVVGAVDIPQIRDVVRRAVPTANIRIEPAGNTAIIVGGTVDRPEDLSLARQTVQAMTGQGIQILDGLRVGGVQQVQLDVVVASVSRTELRAMAFNFFADSQNFFLASTIGNAAATPPQIGQQSQFLNVAGVLTGVPGAPNGQSTNFLGGVLHNSWGFLHFLQALRNEGVVKLLAEPRLVTMSGRQASFLVGGDQAIPVPAGLGQVGVQFEEFGTRLNFIPVVLGNGRIHLEVEPEVSALDQASGTSIQGTVVPGRVTQRVRTTVELETGQTFVIGGLIQHVVNTTSSKVPVLGDLPWLGALFSSKSSQENEQEVVVLVTPHLVDGMACDQFPKCLPGQETRTPDDFELFLEGILEAPRGQRSVCEGKVYVPAWKHSPTAGQFPCCGDDDGYTGHGRGLRRGGSCSSGNCGHHAASAMSEGQPKSAAAGSRPMIRDIGMVQPVSAPTPMDAEPMAPPPPPGTEEASPKPPE